MIYRIYKRFEIFNEIVKKTKSDLDILNKINIEHEWLQWYKESCIERLTFLKLNRFIPIKYISNKYKMLNTINHIKKNNTLVLDEVLLPYPKSIDKYSFYAMICDSLLAYLLRDIDIDYNDYIKILSTTYEGPYELGEVRLSENDIVIDAGANIGDFSVLASVKGCKVYSFEPLPYVVDKYLSVTAKLNPNIFIKRFALSDICGDLYFNDGNMTGTSFKKTKSGNKLKIKAITLDAFVNESKLSRVDFIKADIEGAERYMLMGAKNVLKEFAPKIAICKYHLPDDPKIIRELILDANPNYIIEEQFKKIYAYVPK